MRHTMLAGLASLFAATPQAQAANPVFDHFDATGPGYLQISFGLLEKSARLTLGDTTVVSLGGRVVQGAMLHAFRVDVVDAAGRPVQGSASWELTVFAGAQDVRRTRLRSLVTLNAFSCEIALPKPLGFRIAASDSLLIVATFHETDSQAAYFLRLSVEYEPLTGPLSRLAVIPLEVSTANFTGTLGATTTATQSWEWQADLSGRLLAIAGLPLDGVAELVLQDVETGAVLWNAIVGRHAQSGPAGRVVRLGVPVQEGRGYRLTATYRASHLRVGATAVAMVLPSRS
jgi:hypothetical protein